MQEGNCKLVYYEEFETSREANRRDDELTDLHESIIKELIQSTNPMTLDLLKEKQV